MVEGDGDAVAIHGPECYTLLPPWSRARHTERAPIRSHQSQPPLPGTRPAGTAHRRAGDHQRARPTGRRPPRPGPTPPPAPTGQSWRLDEKTRRAGRRGVAAGPGRPGRRRRSEAGRDEPATARTPVLTHYRQGMPSLAERLGYPPTPSS